VLRPFIEKRVAAPRNICRNEFDMEMKGAEQHNILTVLKTAI
jgi:hypothetical protein